MAFFAAAVLGFLALLGFKLATPAQGASATQVQSKGGYTPLLNNCGSWHPLLTRRASSPSSWTAAEADEYFRQLSYVSLIKVEMGFNQTGRYSRLKSVLKARTSLASLRLVLQIGWLALFADILYWTLGGAGQLDDVESISQSHATLNEVLYYGGLALFLLLLLLSWLRWRINQREQGRE